MGVRLIWRVRALGGSLTCGSLTHSVHAIAGFVSFHHMRMTVTSPRALINYVATSPSRIVSCMKHIRVYHSTAFHHMQS